MTSSNDHTLNVNLNIDFLDKEVTDNTTPYLHHKATINFEGESSDSSEGDVENSDKVTFASVITMRTSSLAKGILAGAVSCMIQFFSALFVNNTTIHYVSRKNDLNLFNGMSLAMNILNCFSFYVIFHSNVGFNAAASQARGAKNKKLVGLYLHRTFIIHFLYNFIAYAIMLSAPTFFKALGVDASLTDVAFNFLIMSPGYIFGVIIFDTLKNFLYVHRIFKLPVIIQIIIAVTYWFLGDYLFLRRDLGLKGLVFALTAAQLMGVVSLIVILLIWRPNKLKGAILPPSKESFQKLWDLIKIFIGVGGMGYIECFAYRLQAFASLYFASTELGALTAFLGFGDLFYVLPVGISFPAIVYIGGAMGAKNQQGVKRVMKVMWVIALVILACVLTAFTFLKDILFSFYTDNSDVLSIMDKMGFLYYFTYPADFIQTILAGIIKGVGQEKIGTKMFLIALYCVGLPSALIFGFYFNMQAVGMWLGNGIGLYVAVILFIWIVYKIDYEKQFIKVLDRVRTESARKASKLSSKLEARRRKE